MYLKKKHMSGVGFEPTPSYEDQNAHELVMMNKQDFILSLAP